MTFRLYRIPDTSVIVGVFGKEYNIRRDTPAFAYSMNEMLAEATDPVYFLVDMRELQITFSDMVSGLAMVALGDLAVMRHPLLSRVGVVTQIDLVRLGAKALTQSQYGKLRVVTFDTLEQALQDAGISTDLFNKVV
jgi:hypothetical protein